MNLPLLLFLVIPATAVSSPSVPDLNIDFIKNSIIFSRTTDGHICYEYKMNSKEMNYSDKEMDSLMDKIVREVRRVCSN